MSEVCEALAYGNLEAFVGRQVALSAWGQISQEDAVAFGGLTRDPDPMHVDPQWAGAHSPYGRTVAAGLHMMALLPSLTRGADLNIEGVGLAMNYGFNRVRFISPLPLDTPFRNRVTLIDVERRSDGNTAIVTRNQFELAEESRPVLIAEWVNLLWPAKS
ncbi:MAG: enoyl-CoA hydratase [Caulobacter sp.]|jgi:acyl dehydratase|nr:enoyl-CoA hydratase [Caulobacter sp.]